MGVNTIDYSLDGGRNWLPVDLITDQGKKSVTFEFTPFGLEDGNYQIKVRAKDSSGNTGVSKISTMVIDRLPPQVGSSLFSLGPIILRPDANGNIDSIAGLNTRIVLSAVGGPTDVNLFYDSQKISLKKNEESGLWSGDINISLPGVFHLLIKSVDGAGNKTERVLNTITALTPGKIFDNNAKPISKAKVSIYAYEKDINNYILWDANPYQETNPQITGEYGDYNTILPAGKYFMEVTATGTRKIRTEIFELNSATPINQDFYLKKAQFWSNWWPQIVPFFLQTRTDKAINNSLIGQSIPDFNLSTPESEFNNISILGKPTILSFISTWAPQTSDQLQNLDKFKDENQGVNIIAIAVQESVSKINIFKKTGGYKTPIVADPDGILVMPLNIGALPTNIFIDRKGIIKDITVGFLDKDSLLNKMLK